MSELDTNYQDVHLFLALHYPRRDVKLCVEAALELSEVQAGKYESFRRPKRLRSLTVHRYRNRSIPAGIGSAL